MVAARVLNYWYRRRHPAVASGQLHRSRCIQLPRPACTPACSITLTSTRTPAHANKLNNATKLDYPCTAVQRRHSCSARPIRTHLELNVEGTSAAACELTRRHETCNVLRARSITCTLVIQGRQPERREELSHSGTLHVGYCTRGSECGGWRVSYSKGVVHGQLQLRQPASGRPATSMRWRVEVASANLH